MQPVRFSYLLTCHRCLTAASRILNQTNSLMQKRLCQHQFEKRQSLYIQILARNRLCDVLRYRYVLVFIFRSRFAKDIFLVRTVLSYHPCARSWIGQSAGPKKAACPKKETTCRMTNRWGKAAKDLSQLSAPAAYRDKLLA